MITKDLKDKVLALISKDKIDEVFEIYKGKIDSNSPYLKQLIAIEAIYSKWKADDRIGLSPKDEIINKVRSSLIDLTNEIYIGETENSSGKNTKSRNIENHEAGLLANTGHNELEDIDPLVANLTLQKLEEDVMEYEKLLNTSPNREPIFQFLNNHSYFFNTIFRLFGGSPLFSNIKLGSEHIVDFCYCDTNSFGPDWTFVKIESPTYRMFNPNGDISQELNHAIRVVTDWRDWIKENISYIRKLMPAIDFPKNYIFIGRRKELLDNRENARRLKRLNYEHRRSIEIHTLDYFVGGANSVKNLVKEDKGGSWYIPMKGQPHEELKKGLPSSTIEWINNYNDNEYREFWTKERVQQRAQHHLDKDGEQLI